MADQPVNFQTTLAVLAGGRGSRMGGPKDRVRIGGKPILDYLLDRLDWPGPTLLVTAPGATAMDGDSRFTSIVADPVEGEGPLRGVLTALERVTNDDPKNPLAASRNSERPTRLDSQNHPHPSPLPAYRESESECRPDVLRAGPTRVSPHLLVITTIDMPGWDRAKLQWLIEALHARPQSLGAMLRHDQQIEPFPLVIRRAGLPAISSLFDRGERSVMSLSHEARFDVVAAPADWAAVTWTNLNRPADVAAFECGSADQ